VVASIHESLSVTATSTWNPLAAHHDKRYSKETPMVSAAQANDFDIAVPSYLLEQLAKRSNQLQMLPVVASEAIGIANKPNSTIAEFAVVVERDLKLATDMLKIANSTLYNPSTPITNLHRAVIRLGFQECKFLIMAASAAGLMNRISMEHEWVRVDLWRHSFYTALLSIHLNRIFRLGFQGEEFTAGLLHDFGRTLLAIAVPHRFHKVDPMKFDESCAIQAHEQSVIGTDHCQLGAWYALQQQLPSPLPELILCHHRPELAGEGRCLTALVAVADHVANHLHLFGTSEGYLPSSNPYWPILAEFADSCFERRFKEAVPVSMQNTQRDVAVLLNV